jgi:hypothetical protein
VSILDRQGLSKIAESLGGIAGRTITFVKKGAEDLAATSNEMFSSFVEGFTQETKNSSDLHLGQNDADQCEGKKGTNGQSSNPKATTGPAGAQKEVLSWGARMGGTKPETNEGDVSDGLEDMESFAKELERLEAEEAADARNIKAFCRWKNCNSERFSGEEYCSHHQREYEQFRARHCGNKRRHLTLEDAKYEAADLSMKSNLNYVAYSCRICNFYHIGRTNLG